MCLRSTEPPLLPNPCWTKPSVAAIVIVTFVKLIKLYSWWQKKSVEELRFNKLINQARREVVGCEDLINRFERNISVLGRSQSTFSNYARHVAAISLYFGKIPPGLDSEQVQDYLYFLQKKSKTPSQTYFKHTVYGLLFLLKNEGLPYEFLHLPSIKHEKKLPLAIIESRI